MDHEDFNVRLLRPEGVSVQEMTKYIRDAVALWCKSVNPSMPMFTLKSTSITVRKVL